MAVRFLSPRGPYGCFSNFYRAPLLYHGLTWPTSEHAYQAMKFFPDRPDLMENIRGLATPRSAADYGRDPTLPLRKDWNQLSKSVLPYIEPDDEVDRPETEEAVLRVKDLVMYSVCWAKFTQNPQLKAALYAAEGPIIEDSPRDAYWGIGPVGCGQNKLGRILMIVRDRILSRD